MSNVLDILLIVTLIFLISELPILIFKVLELLTTSSTLTVTSLQKSLNFGNLLITNDFALFF